MSPLVSIIIPTYNRAHLIAETLNSISAQTYTNWECIVVDDGSTDHTASVMATFIVKDTRFQYHHRPKNRPRGGNAARNYGFECSKGDYIQWFDSDDLMVAEKLKLKVEALSKPNIDFVISKTKYFNKIDGKIYPYAYTADQVTFESYTTSYISWFTPDLMLKRKFASQVSFNEEIKAGQEYNFCSKLTLLTNKLAIVNQYLTLRRAHEESIGAKRQKDKAHYLQTKFHLHWVTYLELQHKTDSIKFKKYSLLLCVFCYFQNKQKIKLPEKFHQHIVSVFGYKYMFFVLGMLSKFLTGRYHFFYSRLKK